MSLLFLPVESSLPPLLAKHSLFVHAGCRFQQLHKLVSHCRQSADIDNCVTPTVLCSQSFKEIAVLYTSESCGDITSNPFFFLTWFPARLEECVLEIHLFVTFPFLRNIVQSLFEEDVFSWAFSSGGIQYSHGFDHSAKFSFCACAHLVHGRYHAHDRIDSDPSGDKDNSIDVFAFFPVQSQWGIGEVPAHPERHG